MACRAGRRVVHGSVVIVVLVSALALSVMAGGLGVRHAAAISPGCNLVNILPDTFTAQFPLADSFEAGEVIAVTAKEPSAANPSFIQILVNNVLTVQAQYINPPVTASYTVPTNSFIAFTFNAPPGAVTMDFACTPVPPTPTNTPADTATHTPTDTPTDTATGTATDVPTDTATVTQTFTATATVTGTPPPTDTATTSVTKTPPIVCCAESPTATADAGGTQTAVAGANETAAAQTATAEDTPTAEVSELPDTGSRPSNTSGNGMVWLLLALVVATVFAIGGLRARLRS